MAPCSPKVSDRPRVGRVAHRLVVVQLRRERVDQRLLRAHRVRPPALLDRRDDRRVEAGFQSDRRVDVPLQLLRPFPRGDQDDELAQPQGQHAAVAQVQPHVAGVGHQLGTAQERHERSEDRRLSRRQEGLGGRLLLRAECVGRKRRQAVLGQGGQTPEEKDRQDRQDGDTHGLDPPIRLPGAAYGITGGW